VSQEEETEIFAATTHVTIFYSGWWLNTKSAQSHPKVSALAAVWWTVLLFPFTTQRTLHPLTYDRQERLEAVPVCAFDCSHNFLGARRTFCRIPDTFPSDRLRPRL